MGLIRCEMSGCDERVRHVEFVYGRQRHWCYQHTPWSGHYEYCSPACAALAPPLLELNIAMRLPTPNRHGPMRERIGMGKKQREIVVWHLRAHELKHGKPLLPCAVELTRLSPRNIATDGAISSLKWVRDSVAMWLLGGKPGERDDDPRIEWRYPAPERSKLPGVRVRVLLTERGPA